VKLHSAGALLGIFSLLSACDPAAPTPDAGLPGDAFLSDAPSEDASAGGDASAGDDASTPSRCVIPTPLVAGTPATDAIANAPPRCGSVPGAWLRSSELGSVVSRRAGSSYTAAALQALAASQSVMLPRTPENNVRTETLVYTTQDRGALVQSTALIAYPNDRPEGTDVPIVLVLHGTSGFRAGCGPTNDLAAGLLAAVFASYGWIAVAPDYLGLENAGEPYGALHPYLIGEATAIASLDAARAAMHTVAANSPTVCAQPRLAVFGGSQGGHATLWVDRLAPYYAREFALLGGVATVPTGDLLGQSQRAVLAPVQATANLAASLVTQADWYDQVPALSAIFKSPFNTSIATALAANCDPGDALNPDLALSDLFTDSFLASAQADIRATAPVGCWLAESSLTTTSIPRINVDSASYGMLFVLGSEDQLIHPPIERAAYDTLCAGGTPLEYLECEGASHTRATAWAIPEVFSFLDARRAGTAFAPQCTRPAASRCMGTPAP